jgi:hypothetical protein
MNARANVAIAMSCILRESTTPSGLPLPGNLEGIQPRKLHKTLQQQAA